MNYLLEAASIYDDIRQMIYENAQDAEYLAAVEAGDMNKAQRMVNSAANNQKYNATPMYRGEESEKYVKIFDRDATWFAFDEDIALLRGDAKIYYLKPLNILDL